MNTLRNRLLCAAPGLPPSRCADLLRTAICGRAFCVPLAASRRQEASSSSNSRNRGAAGGSGKRSQGPGQGQGQGQGRRKPSAPAPPPVPAQTASRPQQKTNLTRQPISAAVMDAMDGSSQASLLMVQNMVALCKQLRLPVSYKVRQQLPCL